MNKKSYETLVYSCAFDKFKYNRAQFFAKTENGLLNGIERMIKYANDYQNTQSSSQASLFGGGVASYIPEPPLPEAEEFPLIEKLKYEKDVIGIYLTGHPLDNYKLELQRYCNSTVTDLVTIQKARSGEGGDDIKAAFADLRKKGELCVGGLVSNVQHKMTKTGKPFGTFVLEDYNDSYEFALFGDDYVKFRNLLVNDYFLQLRGSIEEKFRQKDNWDMRINSIVLLTEIRDKMAKSMTVCLELNSVNNDLMDCLQQIVETNNQKYPVKNCTLRFMVKDIEEALLVELPSKTFKVNYIVDLLE